MSDTVQICSVPFNKVLFCERKVCLQPAEIFLRPVYKCRQNQTEINGSRKFKIFHDTLFPRKGDDVSWLM